MNYFDDLEVPFAMPVADGHCRTHTPLYYGIQYNQAGVVELKIGNGPRRIVSGPLVFITHPSTEFSYYLQPGVRHYYYAVCFTGERVRKFIKGGLLSLEPVIYPVRDTARFMQTIQELIKMRSLGQQALCVNLVESLLLQLQLPGERKFINQTPYQINVLKSLAEKIRQRVYAGMGFVALHSAHHSKPFKVTVGTTGNLSWGRNQKGIVWNLAPTHPIAQGIPPHFEIFEEMYGEPFCIPKPDDLIFATWYEDGNLFRGGATFVRGAGKVFYFHPGHETCESFYNPFVRTIIRNGVRWCAPARLAEGFNLGGCYQQHEPVIS